MIKNIFFQENANGILITVCLGNDDLKPEDV